MLGIFYQPGNLCVVLFSLYSILSCMTVCGSYFVLLICGFNVVVICYVFTCFAFVFSFVCFVLLVVVLFVPCCLFVVLTSFCCCCFVVLFSRCFCFSCSKVFCCSWLSKGTRFLTSFFFVIQCSTAVGLGRKIEESHITWHPIRSLDERAVGWRVSVCICKIWSG